MQIWPRRGKIRLQILEPRYESQIVRVRKSAFAFKYGSRVDLKGLEWNRMDQLAIHFGAFHGDELVSVLRLNYLDRSDDFQKLLQFSPDHSFAEVPSYTLARAATALNFRNSNLSMRLRVEAYKYVSEHTREARFIFGTMLAKSQRLTKLESLGYEILVHHEGWKGYLNSNDEPIAIFRLPVDRLSRAITLLDQEFQAVPRKNFLARFFE